MIQISNSSAGSALIRHRWHRQSPDRRAQTVFVYRWLIQRRACGTRLWWAGRCLGWQVVGARDAHMTQVIQRHRRRKLVFEPCFPNRAQGIARPLQYPHNVLFPLL